MSVTAAPVVFFCHATSLRHLLHDLEPHPSLCSSYSKLLFIKLLTQPQMGEEVKKRPLWLYKRRRELSLWRLARALREKLDWKTKGERNRKTGCLFLSFLVLSEKKQQLVWFFFSIGLKVREKRELVSKGGGETIAKGKFFVLPCDICLCFFRMMLL